MKCCMKSQFCQHKFFNSSVKWGWAPLICEQQIEQLWPGVLKGCRLVALTPVDQGKGYGHGSKQKQHIMQPKYSPRYFYFQLESAAFPLPRKICYGENLSVSHVSIQGKSQKMKCERVGLQVTLTKGADIWEGATKGRITLAQGQMGLTAQKAPLAGGCKGLQPSESPFACWKEL